MVIKTRHVRQMQHVFILNYSRVAKIKMICICKQTGTGTSMALYPSVCQQYWEFAIYENQMPISGLYIIQHIAQNKL